MRYEAIPSATCQYESQMGSRVAAIPNHACQFLDGFSGFANYPFGDCFDPGEHRVSQHLIRAFRVKFFSALSVKSMVNQYRVMNNCGV